MCTIKPFRGQMSDSFRAAVFIVLSGGFQDAYTYTCRGEVFANAQTGNIVLLSTALFQREWMTVVKYLIPVLSFLVGTAVAECVHIRLKACEKIHWRQIILLCEIFLLLGVGFLPPALEPLANALVSFVCAMQVQTFHKVRGHAYASTMCIGNLRSGTAALSAYMREKKPRLLHQALCYFAIILLFAIGAGVGGRLSIAYGPKAIWVSSILLLISFLLMFIEEMEEAEHRWQ